MNQYLQKQLLKSYEKNGVSIITEFCAMSSLSLVEAYEYILTVESNEEIVQFCNKKIKDIKKFYGVK